MILKIFICSPIQNNTIVIGSRKTKKAAVIDPSFDSADKVLNFLKKENIKLEKILLTHSHWDHIADVKKLKEKTSAKIYVHKLDAKNLQHPGIDNVPSLLEIEGVKPDILIKDQDLIEIGDLSLEVIHTPGHTPGGVCYYLEKEDILFSGDTLFKGSFGRVDLATANADEMVKTLKKLSKLPAATKVIPGHGNNTTIGQESWMKDSDQYVQ